MQLSIKNLELCPHPPPDAIECELPLNRCKSRLRVLSNRTSLHFSCEHSTFTSFTFHFNCSRLLECLCITFTICIVKQMVEFENKLLLPQVYLSNKIKNYKNPALLELERFTACFPLTYSTSPLDSCGISRIFGILCKDTLTDREVTECQQVFSA